MTLYELAKQAQDFKDEARETGKRLLNEAFSDFFSKHPAAEKIQWAQYTPYFNDGGACVFSINDWDLRMDPDKAKEMGVPDRVIRSMQEDDDEGEDSYGHGDSDMLYHLLRYQNTERNQKWYPEEELFDYNDTVLQMIADYESLEMTCRRLEDVVMQPVLGDHVLVTVTRDGFDITDYSHD